MGVKRFSQGGRQLTRPLSWPVPGISGLQKCCDALEATPLFSVVNVCEDKSQVAAKYHRPPAGAQLTVTLLPEEQTPRGSTRGPRALPNLFTLIFATQQDPGTIHPRSASRRTA